MSAQLKKQPVSDGKQKREDFIEALIAFDSYHRGLNPKGNSATINQLPIKVLNSMDAFKALAVVLEISAFGIDETAVHEAPCGKTTRLLATCFELAKARCIASPAKGHSRVGKLCRGKSA